MLYFEFNFSFNSSSVYTKINVYLGRLLYSDAVATTDLTQYKSSYQPRYD